MLFRDSNRLLLLCCQFFTAIFGAIIAVISTVIASWGLATYSVGGVLHTSGNIINIFLSFYVGYKVYKRITRVKVNQAEE